ncbi:ABC transporter substrate-binding protein [Clostridium fallax]|uniref:Peptide/nickel transport system substrate-binding protein n=1 Tax=Clostridium fallax TaxID=1533 RepID=A0A1M4YWS5_9CLOT|nr:ABC transporter substrate-binding protein [Clostridium fallax]SHF10158.1 peptide/nickel transport system substrate-binding protein [Clostridium fallax]SQB22270.1 peptide ABC transporter periplasmic protein [Clostridium fallax]
MKRLNIIVLVIIIVSFFFTGCIKEKEVNLVKEDSNNVVIGVDKLPETLDINSNLSVRDYDIFCALFDGLVELKENGEVVGALAEKYEVSNDGLEYIFYLRDNLYWSNGTEINSDDFITFFKEILSPNNKGVEDLYSIYGVKDYNEGKSSFEKNVSIMKVDDKTLKIRMNNKDDNFIYTLAKPKYRLRKINKTLENYKLDFNNLITTGAFTISNVDENEIQLIKRNNYYEKEYSNIRNITIKSTGTEEIALVSLLMEEVDILFDIPISESENMLEKNKLDITPLSIVKLIEFNKNKDKEVNDINLRLAIEQSIIWEISTLDLVKNFKGEMSYGAFKRKSENGAAKVTINKMADYEGERQKAKNKAKDIIKSIDYKGNPLTLLALDTLENKQISDFIAKSLKNISGINVKINLCSEEEFKELIIQNKYDMVLRDYNYEEHNYYDTLNLSDIKNNKDNLIKDKYLISLYFKNLLTCRSKKVGYLSYYGDGILKLKDIIINED